MDLRTRVLEFFRTHSYEEYRAVDLGELFRLDRRGRRRLRRLLGELADEGLLAKRRGGWYRLSRRARRRAAGERTGIFRRRPEGYGFVETGSGGRPVFVRASLVGGAMDGDLVAVRTWVVGDRVEGAVSRVLERSRTHVVGTVWRSRSGLYLEPDDPALGHRMEISGDPWRAEGMAVWAEVERFPEGRRDRPVVRVVRVLGPPGEPETEVAKLLLGADIRPEFPEEAVREAERAAGRRIRTGRRLDLRELFFVTIDPEDAKDFDDALHVERLPEGGYRLHVAIADVAEYVRPGTALDEEARRRGFSVYLPDRAVPMLPAALSSGACSLNPGEDRYAMVVILDLDRRGRVLSERFAEAVIRSRARLSYGQVADVLRGRADARRKLGERQIEHLLLLDEVSRVLLAERRRRGYLEIEVPEPKVLFDESGQVADVAVPRRDRFVKRAYSLVEHCMLAANEAVGRLMAEQGRAVPWRIHPEPDPARLERLGRLFEALGMEVPEELQVAEAVTPKSLARIARRLGAHPDGDILGVYLLSSLAQASYSAMPKGHFALGSGTYLHFTSPIRRYADLLVHRQLKEIVAGGPVRHRPGAVAAEISEEDREALAELAARLSELERKYVDVEREAVNLFRCLLLQDRVGEVFQARVAAVAPFGAFVVVDEPFVEALLRTSSLGGERWELEESGFALVQAGSGRRLAVTDSLPVVLSEVSVTRRQMLVAPAKGWGGGKQVKRTKRSGRRQRGRRR